jgi:hypothetical protein
MKMKKRLLYVFTGLIVILILAIVSVFAFINPIAKNVKLADLAHNSNATRFTGVEIPKEKIGYFRDKYTKAKAILLEE